MDFADFFDRAHLWFQLPSIMADFLEEQMAQIEEYQEENAAEGEFKVVSKKGKRKYGIVFILTLQFIFFSFLFR